MGLEPPSKNSSRAAFASALARCWAASISAGDPSSSTAWTLLATDLAVTLPLAMAASMSSVSLNDSSSLTRASALAERGVEMP